MPKGIRSTMVLLVAITVVPLLVAQSAVFWNWYETRTAHAMDENLSMAKLIAGSFDAFVHDLHRQHVIIANALTGPNPVPRELANEFLRKSLPVYPTGTSGTLLHTIALTDRDGKVIACSNPSGIGVDLASRGYFKQLQAGKDLALSDFHPESRIGPGPVVVMASAIRDDAGNLTNVMVTAFDPRELGTLNLMPEGAGDRDVVLMDSTGTIVFHQPLASAIGRNVGDSDAIWRQAREDGQAVGTQFSVIHNRQRIAARAKVDDLGFYGGTSVDVDEVRGPIIRSMVWSGVLILTAAAMVVLIAVVISRRIVWDVGELRRHAEAVARGDFDHPNKPAHLRELAELGRTFSAMADRRREAEESLRKTAIELERSNRDLEQFAYVSSHDLQEPLRMVAGYLQLIEQRYQGRLDKDCDEFIAYAVEGADRMSSLINDLLAYSRVNTQEQAVAQVDMNRALQSATESLRLAIERSAAVITNDELPTVGADASQMVRLFQNLISNAIKFHGEQPPRVHISSRKSGRNWVFSVRDNGIGMEQEYLDKIFVIFQRLHGRGKYPGTGIGLAICKRIVERHGGRIWAESEPGKGSTFHFSI